MTLAIKARHERDSADPPRSDSWWRPKEMHADRGALIEYVRTLLAEVELRDEEITRIHTIVADMVKLNPERWEVSRLIRERDEARALAVKWIPVGPALPEGNSRVLVMFRDGTAPNAEYAGVVRYLWKSRERGEDCVISHWAEIPAGPSQAEPEVKL